MRWLFVLSGLMCFTGKPVSSSCPVEMSPSRVVVRFGDPFTVTCNSPAAKIDSMGWEAIYGEGIGNTDNVSSVVLKVNSAKDWDMRTHCFINLLDGFQCMEVLPVTVFKTPDTVSMSISQEGPMVEGTKYRMQCDIGNVAPARNLSVLWHKGNKIIYTETFTESSLSPVNKSSVLKLTAQRGDNGSQIWCEAKLDFSPPVPNLRTIGSKSHEVVVLYSPVFTNPENEMLELSSGSKLSLDCSASGNPTPTYSWGFPHQIQLSTKINGNESIVTPSIELPGSYNCTASNSQGTRTKYFTVTEAKRKPVSSSCPVEMSPSRVVVRFGDPFTVTCNSPAAKIDSMGWEAIYGEGIGNTDNVSSVVLKVNSAKDWDMRTHCFINLLDGFQCMEVLPVTVFKTPDTVSMSISQEGPMVEGTKYRMQCDIGNVAPARNLSVLWHKGNEIIYTETFTESSLSPVNKSSVLKLTAQRGDNGSQIWCEAKLDFSPPVPNLHTIGSKSHDVVVLYSPVFTNPENEMLELSSGSKLSLDCSASGNPTPTYSWGFPHQIQLSTKINGNESILTPSIELPGSYNCTASNSQGTRTKYFTVTEAKRDHTIVAALVGVVGLLGVAGLLAGLFFVKSDGTFPCNKGSYLKGQPISSGPV